MHSSTVQVLVPVAHIHTCLGILSIQCSACILSTSYTDHHLILKKSTISIAMQVGSVVINVPWNNPQPWRNVWAAWFKVSGRNTLSRTQWWKMEPHFQKLLRSFKKSHIINWKTTDVSLSIRHISCRQLSHNEFRLWPHKIPVKLCYWSCQDFMGLKQISYRPWKLNS